MQLQLQRTTAADSLLEQAGFEPLFPGERGGSFETALIDFRPSPPRGSGDNLVKETGSSNLLSSSSESVANCARTRLGFGLGRPEYLIEIDAVAIAAMEQSP